MEPIALVPFSVVLLLALSKFQWMDLDLAPGGPALALVDAPALTLTLVLATNWFVWYEEQTWWYQLVYWHGVARCGTVRCGTVWYGVAWCGTVLCGTVHQTVVATQGNL